MIRSATAWDGPEIERMLLAYGQASPLDFHKNTDITHARKILAQIWAGAGLAFVAEDKDGIHGMLLAVKNTNLWDPNIVAMNELAFWVDPEHRGSTSGHRLLLTYVNACENLKKQNKIRYFTMSKMSNSPDLKYDRFGFGKLEEMWSQ